MTNYEIIEKANEAGFKIHVKPFSKNSFVNGKLAGSKLNFPIAYNDETGLQFEISWNLAQRIAIGQVKTIMA